MRVTDGMRDAATLAATTSSSSAVFTASKTASSGLRVADASDDPGAYARIVSAGDHARRLAARVDALDRATGDAAAAESALAGSAEIMLRAREIATEMADGTAGAGERAAAATAIDELRQALVGLANARGSAGHLFGGSRTAAPPFTNGTFSGDDAALAIETDDGVTIRSNASGATAFTAAGGRDLFADLGTLATALAGNDAAGVSALIAPLQQGHQQIERERGRVGLGIERMRTSSEAASRAQEIVEEARARDSEADATVAYTRLVQAQAAYERTLEVSKKLLSTLAVERMLP